MNCPVCMTAMEKRSLPQGLQIDYCDAHGVWLEKGELEALIGTQAAAAPQSELAEKAKDVATYAAKRMGDSMLFGAGATAGSRLVGGMIDSLFGKKR